MRTKKTNSPSKSYRAYWLTPNAWKHACGRGCGSEQSVAYRRSDRSYVCGECIERLGIKAWTSKAWQT